MPMNLVRSGMFLGGGIFKDWFSLCWIYLDSFLADAVTEELDFVGEEGTLLRVESYSSVFQPL